MATMRENRNQHALGVVALVALLLGRPCHAQMEPCPSNGALTGYASIAALNNDIEAELARISGGGEPENEYVYMLCPRQEFDAALEPLRPLLSGSVFRCGVSGQSTDRCTIQGGSEQIRIEDSVISTFPLNDVSFVGLTFDGFTNNADNTGASVNVLASATTKVTFSDVVWQNFNTEYVIMQQTAGEATAANVTVEVASVTGGTATVLFDNDGGSLQLVDLLVEEVTVDAVVSSANGAVSKLERSTIQSSTVASVTTTASGSSQNVIDTTVTNMLAIQDAFFGTGADTTVSLTGTTVENNLIVGGEWRVLNARNGASGSATASNVARNTGIQFAFLAASSLSEIIIDDSFILDNNGIGSDTTSAPVLSLSGAIVSIERTQFSGNTDFTSQALVFFASRIAIQQSCFQDSQSTFVVFVDDDSIYSGAQNFVESDVDSTFCPAPGNRLFREDGGADCFLGGDCDGRCEVLANSDRCLAVAGPTTPPTSVPTASPIANTTAPTLVPTLAPVGTAAPTNASAVTGAPTRAPSVTGFPTISPVVPPTIVPTTLPPTSVPVTNLPTSLPTTGSPAGLCPGAKLIKAPKRKPKTKLSMYARSGSESRMKKTKDIHPTYKKQSVNQVDPVMEGNDIVDMDAGGEEQDGYWFYYICPPTDPPASESKGKGMGKGSKSKMGSKSMKDRMKGGKKGSGKMSDSKKSAKKGKSKRALEVEENPEERRPGLLRQRL